MCVSPYPQINLDQNAISLNSQHSWNWKIFFVIEPKPELNETLYSSDCLFLAGTYQSFLENAKLLSTPIHFFFFLIKLTIVKTFNLGVL